jgi:hypothetical protein
MSPAAHLHLSHSSSPTHPQPEFYTPKLHPPLAGRSGPATCPPDSQPFGIIPQTPFHPPITFLSRSRPLSVPGMQADSEFITPTFHHRAAMYGTAKHASQLHHATTPPPIDRGTVRPAHPAYSDPIRLNRTQSHPIAPKSISIPHHHSHLNSHSPLACAAPSGLAPYFACTPGRRSRYAGLACHGSLALPAQPPASPCHF